ncbi:glycosyltransferase family 4 protein [Pasteurella sp. PK-2025]|uniref:glycosyltransferase family 4 protein n=1 Tax=Pasteurella sp. PK-2025 TaxID=3413133 RepID=UPI003C752F02
MKILLLTQWFDPEPTFKGLAFAKALKAQGHEVQVLTGFPNYPGGKIYEGYQLKFFQKEIIDDIPVLRVLLYPSHDSSALKRIFNYVSFAFMAMLFGIFATKKADVIYAYHPPLTTGIAAVFIKLFRRTPVVYDIQDLWPDTLKATGMLTNDRILRVVDNVCRFVYQFVDHIVVLSPGFKQRLLNKGVPENKISIIYNWCNEKELANADPSSEIPLLKHNFNIVFAGNMGKAQALETILAVAQQMQEYEDIHFVFVGAGTETEQLKQKALHEGLNNTTFIPRVPMSQVGNILNQAQCLLVHLKKDSLFEITVPSKTQAYMAIGKPIIMAVSGDAAELVKQAKCGETAISEDVSSIKQAILAIYTKSPSEQQLLGNNGKDFYFKALSLQEGVKKFITVFEKVIK